MNNIQADVLLEFQQSIANITRFGEELETLDSRFGSLDQRIDAMKTSLTALGSQMNKGTGNNLRKTIEKELNDLIASNGVVLASMGTKALKVDKATMDGVFAKVETELNSELRKFVQRMKFDITGSTPAGGKLPISNEDFAAINKEIAKVIRLQIKSLVAAIQAHNKDLIDPATLDGLKLTIGKSTVTGIVRKIKEEIVRQIANPVIAEGVQMKFTQKDLNGITKSVREQLLKAMNVTIPDMKAADLGSEMKKIPVAIEREIDQYLQRTVSGINGAMAGKIEVPIGNLSKKMRNLIAREMNTTVESLNSLGTIDMASLQGYGLKAQLERISKALDKKLSTSLQEEVELIIKAVNDVEIIPSPKLKRHLVNQINRINNKLIEKIREQVDVQVQSIIQEISEVQARPRSLNRDRMIRNAGNLGGRVSSGNQNNNGNSGSSGSGQQRTTIVGSDPYSRRDNFFNGFGLMGAVTNTLRHIMAGSIVGAPMMMLYNAVETFKVVQTEQIKMMQNLMLKDGYQTTDATGREVTDSSKVNATVTDIQKFVQQQSRYYGTDFNQMNEVAGIGSRLLDTPAEIKKFVQLSAQLQTLDPGSNILNIAGGMESVMAQFGLNIGQMQKELSEPIAAVTQVTNATVEQIMDALKRSGSTMANSNVDPETAVVLAATSIQSTALEGSNIGNFYNSMLNRLQSDGALNQLDKMGINPYEKDRFGTGAKELRPAADIMTDVAKYLSDKDSDTKRDTYIAMFGAYQASKGAATTNQMMVKFAEILEKVQNFNEEQYVGMITQSLDNPLVNTNRARESWSVAFSNIVTELTPVINRVSYALMNMADKVSDNAANFVALGDVLAHVLVGMLMMRGIKWGAGQVWGNVSGNAATHRERSGVLDRFSDYRRNGLLDNDFERYGRRDVARMQKDPVLGGYLKDLHGMSAEQNQHMRDYMKANNIQAKDLPTLMAAMEESRNWQKEKDLTDDDKFDRTKQYNNRLSTRPELANIVDPAFMQTMNNSTANRQAYDNHRTNVQGYANVSDRMSRMSQNDFSAFEDSLMERHRNGLPAITDVDGLSSALDDFEKSQQAAAQAARQASPTYNNLSNALRGMEQQMTRVERARSGFTKFLKDIPNLGRGALSSIKNLAGGVAKLGGEMLAAIGLAEAARAMSESYLATDDQRLLTQADASETDMKALANTIKSMNKGGSSEFFTGLTGLYNSAMNGISGAVGGTETRAGNIELRGNPFDPTDLGIMGDMMNYFNFSGNQKDFAKWLESRKDANGYAISVEDSVNEFAQGSGRAEDVRKLREEAAIKQYEKNKLKEQEEAELEAKAKAAYEAKYGADNATKYPTINPEEVIKRVDDKIKDIQNESTVQTLRSLMNGMKTDSEEYIALRKKQVEDMRAVLDAEIKIIDGYIKNAQKIMDNTEEGSDEYNSAKEARDSLTDKKNEILTSEESNLLQQEYQQEQDAMTSRMGRVTKDLQKLDLVTQARELAAAYNMDTNSKAYYDTMKQITINKITKMKEELEELKAIATYGDLSDEQANQVLQLQNSIYSERSKLKEYNLATIGLGRQRIQDNNSERENELLALQVRAGNPSSDSPILRNKRISNYRSEISEISTVIGELQARLKKAGAEEGVKIQQEIRDLQKQSLQAQLGILDEMKSGAGTFNLPDGVTAMSRYEYLTRNGTHTSTTVGMGDVTVNITLPNVTGATSSEQLNQIGQGLGQGLAQGRVGGVRQQLGGNPQTGYRSRYSR